MRLLPALSTCFVLFAALVLPLSEVAGAGAHSGEAVRISTTVEFLAPSGWTTTDATGTRYVFRRTTFEPKIYAPEFWGTFPGYYYGSTMRFTVTIANTAPKGSKPLTVAIDAISNVLEVDGTFGQQLGTTQEWIIEGLAPGQSRTLSGSVAIVGDHIPSGLDITSVRIRHLNHGRNSDAGLISTARAIWCPPDADAALPTAND
ncbi:MAG: hypothetical protein H0V44_18745 [Planctomycetes bacterium]|nr:hypothetical protein [Planctomycetota bacterium]